MSDINTIMLEFFHQHAANCQDQLSGWYIPPEYGFFNLTKIILLESPVFILLYPNVTGY